MGQAVRGRLFRVLQADSIIRAVAKQATEARKVLRCRDQQDFPEPRQHQNRQRIIDHRLVVNGQKLFAYSLRDRVQTRASTPRQYDAFHNPLFSFLHPVHPALQPQNQTRTFDMRPMSQTVQPAAQPARRRQSRDRVVQTRRDQNAKTQNDVQLKVDGRTAPIKQPPAQHDEEIQGQDHHRGPRMGETQTDEQVVKVRLVRLERRHTADDTSAHHAQRVEYRDGKNRQREGNEPEIRKPELPAERIVPECPDDEHRDDDAQHERAASPMNILDRCPYTL